MAYMPGGEQLNFCPLPSGDDEVGVLSNKTKEPVGLATDPVGLFVRGEPCWPFRCSGWSQGDAFQVGMTQSVPVSQTITHTHGPSALHPGSNV